jgi:hypothetical protein
VTAPIIKHDPPVHPDDDPRHPIPSIAVLDVVVFRKSGGAELTIVIDTPLAGDELSLRRLLDKIEGYLGHLQSSEFQAEAP